MTSRTAGFAARHAWDRLFFLGFAAIAWLSIVMGFGPGVKGMLTGVSPYPHVIIHVHSVVFGGWLALFTAQAWLIGSGQMPLHRRLGLLAVPMIPLMVLLGVAATLISRHVYFAAGRTDTLAFMIVPLTDMILFPTLAVAALVARHHAPWHKRLMLAATTTLLPASFGRWIGPWILANFGDGFFGFMAQSYAGPDALIAAGMIHDRVTRGRVHTAWWVALALIVPVQMATSAIYHWDGWLALATRMIGF